MSGLMITDQSYQSIVENREDAVICVCPTLKTHLAIPKKLTFGNPNHPNAALNLKWKKNNSDRHITKSVRFWTLIQCSFILAFSRKHKKQNKKPKSDQDQEGKGKEAQSMAELNQGLSSSEETENTLEAPKRLAWVTIHPETIMTRLRTSSLYLLPYCQCAFLVTKQPTGFSFLRAG